MTWVVLLIAVLILAGLALLAIELLTPIFGLFLGMGLASMAGAVVLTFVKVSPTAGVVLTVVLLAAVPAYLYTLPRVLPRWSVTARFFLAGAPTDTTGTGTPEAAGLEALVGRTGTAETVLRPSGAVRIDGRRLVATAESGMIDRGAAVEVVRSSGMNIVVRVVPRDG
ncbi:MAG TPA: NfeD family protein [Phycisphaerae bacterium]|nr:NfeD family protein [Phycisphaerae bacterium]